MIDIKRLKENKTPYITGWKNRGLDIEKTVDDILRLYDDYLTILKEEQSKRTELNEISESIKSDFKNAKLKSKATLISQKVKELTQKKELKREKIFNDLSYLPNIPKDDTPIGLSEADNKVVKTYLEKFKTNKTSINHWEFMDKKKYWLTKESGEISGTRQVIYQGKLALLVNALIKFMLDTHVKDGWIIIEPPIIVNERALFNTGQLPKFKDDLYSVGDNQYLIPTAEVPLTNINANSIIDEEKLPLNYVSATSCFRREAGAGGKDSRGLIRLHQFRKVELVTIGSPKDEEKDFNNMLLQARKVVESLELPYNVTNLCTGDISFSAQKTYDINVWMPGSQKYREVSSISSTGDFQTRRLNTKAKLKDGTKVLAHAYNGSALAIERIVAAIIENNIDEDYNVKVPKALLKYLDFKIF